MLVDMDVPQSPAESDSVVPNPESGVQGSPGTVAAAHPDDEVSRLVLKIP